MLRCNHTFHTLNLTFWAQHCCFDDQAYNFNKEILLEVIEEQLSRSMTIGSAVEQEGGILTMEQCWPHWSMINGLMAPAVNSSYTSVVLSIFNWSSLTNVYCGNIFRNICLCSAEPGAWQCKTSSEQSYHSGQYPAHNVVMHSTLTADNIKIIFHSCCTSGPSSDRDDKHIDLSSLRDHSHIVKYLLTAWYKTILWSYDV